jgi:DNA-binding CsgD family transcriptional regulator
VIVAVNHDILAMLYDGVLDDTRLEKSLAMLANRFDSPSISLLSLNMATPKANAVAASGVFGNPKAIADYHTNFASLDPAPAAFAQSRVLSATTTERLMEEGRIDEKHKATQTFLNEFYRPLGLEHCLGANLSCRNGHSGLIGIHRGRDYGPYSEEDVRDLEVFIPHIARALQLRRDFAEMSIKSSMLATYIDRLTAGVIILDPLGRVVHSNRAMREMAARNDGLTLNRNGLPFGRSASGRQEVERLCEVVRSGGCGGIARLARKDGGRPYAIHITPLYSRSVAGLRESDVPYTLMIIHDPEASVESPFDIIATVFELPTRTAEFAVALAEGEAPNEYAERRGISINAVKYHLKTAFARTGFRRQSELARAVARALAELGRRKGNG